MSVIFALISFQILSFASNSNSLIGSQFKLFEGARYSHDYIIEGDTCFLQTFSELPNGQTALVKSTQALCPFKSGIMDFHFRGNEIYPTEVTSNSLFYRAKLSNKHFNYVIRFYNFGFEDKEECGLLAIWNDKNRKAATQKIILKKCIDNPTDVEADTPASGKDV